MTARTTATWPTGRHRLRDSLRRAVTPSVFAVSVPVLALTCVVLLGVVVASAATLGGLKNTDLGASDASVAIHTAGINATWSPLVSGTTWVVNGITLTTNGSDTFAANERLSVALINSSGGEICGISVTNATSGSTITIARAAINTACGTTGIDFATLDRIAVTAQR